MKIKDLKCSNKRKIFFICGIVCIVSVFCAVTFFAVNNNNIGIKTNAEKVITTENIIKTSAKVLGIKCEKDVYTIEIGKTVLPKIKVEPKGEVISAVEWKIKDSTIATVNKKGEIQGISTGKTTILATVDNGMQTSCNINVILPQKYKINKVPKLLQGTELPSGCESVAATMLLNYYGFKISTNDFVDKYLPQSYLETDENGYIGPDIESYYLGSPYSEDALGCYPSVIAYAMNNYFKENKQDEKTKAISTTGLTIDELCNKYIIHDTPVLIWSTMFLNEPAVTYEWKVTETEDYSTYKIGDTCKWLSWEHCLILVGFDENKYYLNDPLIGDEISLDKSEFNLRFKQIGSASLVILNN